MNAATTYRKAKAKAKAKVNAPEPEPEPLPITRQYEPVGLATAVVKTEGGPEEASQHVISVADEVSRG